MRSLSLAKSLLRRSPLLRVAVVFLCAGLAGTGIAWTFWRQELRYALPTPRPPTLQEPLYGTRPLLEGLPAELGAQRPTLLHFFNPDCPCSRFNTDHLRDLQAAYGTRVRFLAVIQSNEADMDEAREESGRSLGGMATFADPSGRLASACGVYSTPQAVILNAEGALVYRGNYNVARYCTEPGTEFARLTLASLVDGCPLPIFPPQATLAYGCELPANSPASPISGWAAFFPK